MAPRKDQKKSERIQKHRELISQYRIIFEGPIPPSTWPAEYASIFQTIREIEAVKYEQFIASRSHRNQYPIPIAERVHRLVRDAYNCRNQCAEEATWRLTTEPSILERFNLDVFCWVCQRRLWISDFQVQPSCPDAAERLQAKRARRVLCTCLPGERGAKKPKQVLQQIFQMRGNAAVIDSTVPEINNGGISQQKPDNVIGLRHTTFFQELLPTLSGWKHSPSSKGSPSFPFLILEAKSELGSVGFESIERQTAFPIRALINIQKGLRGSTASNFDTLVWFLANQGDEWRVYACVGDGNTTRVIDLWHGTILREDCALQLFLIIDLINDWARDIYRKEVLRCLARASSITRDVTPAESNISYNMDSDDEPADHHILVDGESSTADFDISASDSESIVVVADTKAAKRYEPPSQKTKDVLDGSSQNTVSETYHAGQNAVVRHANNVLFCFRHLAIPDDRDELTALIKALDAAKVPYISEKILHLVFPQCPLPVSMALVHELETNWTGHQAPCATADGAAVVLAYISFESYFRESDWKIVRRVTCITASHSALLTLASLSGDRVHVPDDLFSRNVELNLQNVRPLHLLAGEESANAAVSSTQLQLRPIMDITLSGDYYDWHDSDPNHTQLSHCIWVTLEAEHLNRNLVRQFQFSSSSRNIQPSRYAFPEMRFGPKTRSSGAILIKKKAAWPVTCPQYCLLVFDESDIADSVVVVEKMEHALCQGNFFQESGRGVAESDRQAIELWISNVKDGRASNYHSLR